jgi:hypothetical protein
MSLARTPTSLGTHGTARSGAERKMWRTVSLARTGWPGVCASCQAQFLRDVAKTSDVHFPLANRLTIGIRHDGRPLDEELAEVLELELLLADIANPDDQPDRLAVTVGPLLAGRVA